ncbi:MAG TPA: DUF2460 domain-containing protein [Stellaceae bacterium]|nr:DUF2460 domain-containing protein [Stellaceae bacterium]
MLPPLFPTLPGLEYPVQRAPVAASLRQKAISGRETFQPLWAAPLYKYEVSFALLRADESFAEWQLLQGFWNSVMFAPGGVFRFDDPNDDSVAAELFATGDGATTSFQLARSLGGFIEPVLGPTLAPSVPRATLDYGNCTSAPTQTLDYGNCTSPPTAELDEGFCASLQIFAAGLLADWTLGDGGIVTIAPAPQAGAALTWTGAYTWLCRFDGDTLEFSNFMYLFWELKKCSFTTIRL